MRPCYLLLALLPLLAPSVHAQRRLVPEAYPTVQVAIDAAVDGDTVLVAEGTYVENIRFRGKSIVVASLFALDRDPAHIEATVLDGSRPAEPDTASVVLFIEGEGPGAVLEGFTITGGTGTRWRDEHSAGTYVEGGGILAALASPTIRYNRIVGNRADRRPPATTSAGGGGIRAGDGAPRIEHNVIAGNTGMYGGGVVLNYTSALVRNNVVSGNRVVEAVAGAPTFGGGGLWVNGVGVGAGPVVENNTIADNAVETSAGGGAAAGRGGGVLFFFGAMTFRNNVVWDNTQVTGTDFARVSGLVTAFYNDVEGGLDGTGNLDADPLFADGDYHLSPGSPAVDAGDPDPAYDDPEDPLNPGQAAAPALGTVRADMGAYGGPGAADLAAVPTAAEPPPPGGGSRGLLLYPNPTRGSALLRFYLAHPGAVAVQVYDVRGTLVRRLDVPRLPAGPHVLAWDGRDAAGLPVAAGPYLVRLQTRDGAQTQTLVALRH